MRPVLHGDVVTAARALCAAPAAGRAGLAARLLMEAGAADAYRRHTGRRHPAWGDGTLQAAAARRPLAPEPRLDDPVYAECMLLVFEALVAGGPGGRASPRRNSRSG